MIVNGVNGAADSVTPGLPAVLLYHNDNPSTTTSGFTVNIDGGNYSAFIVESQTNLNITTTGKALVMVGSNQLATAGMTPAGYPCTRAITTVSNNQIVFGYGFSSAQDANACIPLNIWGVNLTL